MFCYAIFDAYFLILIKHKMFQAENYEHFAVRQG